MTRFREYKPKQLNNIFLEFENFIPDALRWAEFKIREDEMEMPPNSSLIINDKGEIEDNPDYVDNRKKPHEIIEEVINGRVLESYFEQFINDVESHILNQIVGYSSERITTFFLKQIRFGREFEPEERKPMIYRGFLSYLYTCQIPKEVQLTDNDKKLAKHLFDTYVKYFEELKTKINELKSEYPTSKKNFLQKPELTINQIALKYVYSNQQITRENGNEIAKGYGHNSGEKLFQQYTFYSSTTNRKGRPQPCTPRKLKNKIELLESILNLVEPDNQKKIKDEVSILKNIQEAEYL
jgi:hypothetical protein